MEKKPTFLLFIHLTMIHIESQTKIMNESIQYLFRKVSMISHSSDKDNLFGQDMLGRHGKGFQNALDMLLRTILLL